MYQGFEFAAERLALDPVDHVAAVTGAEGNGAGRVDEGVVFVVLNVLKGVDEINVWPASPLSLNRVHEFLAVSGASSGINRDNDVSMFREYGEVPAGGPGVAP